MSLPIYQVDAFTSRPFHGNPAAVCLLPSPREDAWMQGVAAEMNVSETAFLLKQTDGYGLRWFTPTTEVELCGHATLASAHVLWEIGELPREQEARFYTQSGLLTARSLGSWIELDFPTEPESELGRFPPVLMEGLGVEAAYAVYVGEARHRYVVEVDNEKLLRGLRPDFALLSTLPKRVIATCRSASPGFDFISRYFAPTAGINEDPVTGSAHCTLAPYWSRRLGRTEMTAYQASARGGELKLRLLGERVRIAGQAVSVLAGMLRV